MTLIAHWPLAGDPGDLEDGQVAPDIAAGGSGAHDGIFEVSASEPLSPWGEGDTHLRCNSASSGYVHSVSNLADLVALNGTMTIACWRKKYQEDTAVDYGLLINCGGISDAQAENHQYLFRTRSNGALDLFWENGAGVDVVTTSTTGIIPLSGGWHHVAAVRYEMSPGFYGVKYFVDGLLADTQDNGGVGYAGPDGGANSIFFIGRGSTSQPPSGNDFGIDSVRIYDSDESAAIPAIYAGELPDHNPTPLINVIGFEAIIPISGAPHDSSPSRYGHPGAVALQVFQGERSGRENAGFSSARV